MIDSVDLEDLDIQPPQPNTGIDSLQRSYPVSALGGTFDYLHPGHKILLSMAAWITTSKLIVGVTGQLHECLGIRQHLTLQPGRRLVVSKESQSTIHPIHFHSDSWCTLICKNVQTIYRVRRRPNTRRLWTNRLGS